MLILNDFKVLYIFIDGSVERMQFLNNYTNFTALQTKATKENYRAERLNVSSASMHHQEWISSTLLVEMQTVASTMTTSWEGGGENGSCID